MNRSRPFRVVAALIAAFGVLFMQLAVASYACPTMKLGHAVETMSTYTGGQAMSGPVH